MRKQSFLLMGIVMALAVMIAPPLIGAQAHAVMKPVDYQQYNFDKAAAALYSVETVPAQAAAPGSTKAGTAERFTLTVLVLFLIGSCLALGAANRRRPHRPRREVVAGVGSSVPAQYSGA